MLTAREEVKRLVKEQQQGRVHPVKLTALVYLREALHEERYEDMKELAAIAREFGAEDSEIRKALSLFRN